MQIALLGSTSVDVDLFARAAYETSQIGVNRGVDLHPLHLNETLQFLTQIGTFANDCDNVAVFLRECERELTFLHYIFLVAFEEVPHHESLKFLRYSELNFVATPHNENLVVVAGNLRQWVYACMEGTNSQYPEVVEFFDHIFLALAEVEELSPIFKRFHRDNIDGSHLFKLRNIQ
jgi:hypothetical protein